ncbi:hypothetical protein [Sphingobium indicum]|uniref:Lipoprotein SmpA/OmlA domain-containing protein n=1 Tax=Sphingobium indicum (strain DSM 16412 / CCM 7286 / MTCC 6364 / B90A) TaxID=861109 RepID=A0A1L5BKK0_SPHIB|nr:hypothetical protein [Sphingobium indicum]APL93383.1 hypothetical protein SIDU_01950 [Sphingobium indicum B90A]
MIRYALPLLLAAVSPEAFAADNANTLTHGMVQMTVRVGQTTQAEVLETFGAPNITTIDGSGQEMWVYDRHATVTADSSSGFSIGMLLGAGGGGVGGGAGLGFGKSKSKSTQSSRTMTLVLKFDARKVVSDFRSRSSSF